MLDPTIANTMQHRIDYVYFRSDECSGKLEDVVTREINIPYFINATLYRPTNNTAVSTSNNKNNLENNSGFYNKKSSSLNNQLQRKYFIYAPCAHQGTKPGLNGIRNGSIRELAFNRFQNVSNSLVTITKCKSNFEFIKNLQTSIFCVVLPGDTPSTSKLYKAIHSGCIPIIFKPPSFHLPFERFLNWNLFSIIKNVDDLNDEDTMKKLIINLYTIKSNQSLLNSYILNLRSASIVYDFENKEEWPNMFLLSFLEAMCVLDSSNRSYSSYKISFEINLFCSR
jgi:hypothetical protein